MGSVTPYILGPCRCRGCGEEVVYITDGRARGWLHASGLLRCQPVVTGLTRQERNRLWMRRSRAA